METKEEIIINCPKCKAKFDITEKIQMFEEEVLIANKVLDKIKEINRK